MELKDLTFLLKSDISLSSRLEVEEIATKAGIPLASIRLRANHDLDRWEAYNFNGAAESLFAHLGVSDSGWQTD